MRTHVITALAVTTLTAVALACVGDADGMQTSNAVEAEDKPPVHVDSILPIDEEIRRFRERVGRTATDFDGGTASRAELVAMFVSAVERADTAALVRMSLDGAEFIDLYYPHTMYTHKPYELSPSILWLLMTQNSEKGFVRLLRRYSGQSFGYEGYRCDREPRIEGPNRIWDGCVLDRRVHGKVESLRLFGSIIERAGRFAFVSYANDL
jgi:hypothetical protein